MAVLKYAHLLGNVIVGHIFSLSNPPELCSNPSPNWLLKPGGISMDLAVWLE